MAKLNIPQELDSDFKTFFTLGKEEKESVLTAMDNPINQDEDFMSLVETLKKDAGLSPEKAASLNSLFVSLVAAEAETGVNFDSFIQDVIQHLTDRGDPSLLPPEDFASDMKRVYHGLRKKVKSMVITHQRERLFHDVQIFTDLRPVFSGEGPESVDAMSVIHTIRLRFRENNQNREIYVAVDKKDLSDLKRQIDRAENKEKVIREKFDSPEIPIISY